MALPLEAREEPLRLLAEQARREVAGCAAVALTVVRDDDPVLVVGTNPLGCHLDEVQWAAGHGPGVDAMRQLQVFNVASLVSTRSWPEFTRVALSRGVHSSLAVPITAKGRSLGVLDLYSLEPDAFSGHERVGLQLATEAALLLSGVEWTLGAPIGPSGQGAGVDPHRAVS